MVHIIALEITVKNLQEGGIKNDSIQTDVKWKKVLQK